VVWVSVEGVLLELVVGAAVARLPPGIKVKQAPGWHLAQPSPGVLVWTTPAGRTYTTRSPRRRQGACCGPRTGKGTGCRSGNYLPLIGYKDNRSA